MIITRSPLRITLGGGGTDLPSYYQEHEGFLIAAAIDKYVYITLHQTFEQELIVKYSKLERAKSIAQIQHPIVREALMLVGIENPHLEITSMADIPAGTGLGSSGSFTTALLKALHHYRRNIVHPAELAEQACEIELGRLKEPIGKQDQYIAAFGGLTCFKFHNDGKVSATPLKLSDETRSNLEDNLVLFYTGATRSASTILKDQNDRSLSRDPQMIENLHYTKELGNKSKAAIESGDLGAFAQLMDTHWSHKRARSLGMTNQKIDDCYEYAKKHGSLGGKVIGAGGGGFLMFYTEQKSLLRHAMISKGLKEVRFRFDLEGSRTLVGA